LRGPRLLLLVCLAVGLGAVWFAGRAHLRDVRLSLETSEHRALRADLKEHARELANRIRARLARTPLAATYDVDGRLLRPAPPARAEPWRAFGIALRGLGDIEASSLTSHQRAAALVRAGDVASLRRALAEEALSGTDLAYRVRLEIFRAEELSPDAEWVDDVSALLDGPSDRLGRALLKEAGAEPSGPDRARRRELAGLAPRPGYAVGERNVRLVARVGDRLVLRTLARSDIATGYGPIAEPLPDPFASIEVRGAVDSAAVDAGAREETLKAVGWYGLAALILVVGTVYAFIAMGRAHRLTRAKSDFVANITHELKTPLANIRLYGESLKEGRVREIDRAEFLETIVEEAGRLDQLVEGLLHAARGPGLSSRRIEARELLEEAEARWRPRLEREGYRLTVTAPAELPAVRGDKDALLRALDNLLDNARKYSTRDKRIELSGATDNGAVRLTVRDHGPGIPVADRQRVRKPFTRLESADRKETPGAGLGLSLVVACMEAHGGRVEIGGAGGATVKGYDISVARDGEQGLKEARAGGFDLVLLDIMLPGKSGFEVLKRLRADGNETPVIVLTARGAEVDKIAGLKLGADDYVTKPFSLGELLARIGARLRRARPDVRVDFKALQVERGTRRARLTPTEAEILRFLLAREGEAVPREEMLQELWGVEHTAETRTLDNHVARLRRKLETDPKHPTILLTVPGVGYRLAKGTISLQL
jgi:DNA-binding response OmpR family regulator